MRVKGKAQTSHEQLRPHQPELQPRAAQAAPATVTAMSHEPRAAQAAPGTVIATSHEQLSHSYGWPERGGCRDPALVSTTSFPPSLSPIFSSDPESFLPL